MVERLANQTRTSGKRMARVQRDADENITQARATGEGEGAAQEDSTGGGTGSALLHFSSPRDPAAIAAFLRTRVYRPESLV